jgi:hypothetical protein
MRYIVALPVLIAEAGWWSAVAGVKREYKLFKCKSLSYGQVISFDDDNFH